MLATILRMAASETDMSAHLMTLYALARRCSSVSVPIVELGVRTGNSTLAMLTACDETCGRLVSYDIDSICPSNVRLTARAHSDQRKWERWNQVISERWCFRCRDSIEATHDWTGGGLLVDNPCVGMIFIDTSHEYNRTRNELAAWLPKLRRDAVIAGHDYLLEGSGVKRAVDEFAAENATRFEKIVLPHDYGMFILLPTI